MPSGEIDPDAFNAFEASGWDTKADGYERFVGRVTGRFVEPLLDAASVGVGTRVLDLATGPGYAAAAAAPPGGGVIGGGGGSARRTPMSSPSPTPPSTRQSETS